MSLKIAPIYKSDNLSLSHRCYLCHNYPPELSMPVALKIDLDGSGFNWVICTTCINEMHATLNRSA